MASLIINRDGFRLDELELTHGELSIGRNDSNNLVLNDSTVSGNHCKIVTFFNVSYIEDQASTNGTHVNGQRVQKRTLRDGDVVALGSYQLMFKSSAQQPAHKDANETMLMDREQLQRLMEDSRDSVMNKAAAPAVPARAPIQATRGATVQPPAQAAPPRQPAQPQVSAEDERRLQFLRNRVRQQTAVETEITMAEEYAPSAPRTQAGSRRPVSAGDAGAGGHGAVVGADARAGASMSPRSRWLLAAGVVLAIALVLLIVLQI